MTNLGINYSDYTPEPTIENSERPVILSYSGGLDSTCLLLYYLAQGHTNITAVSFKYGQSHSIELKRAAKIIKKLVRKGFNGISHRIVDLTSAFSESDSALTNNSTTIIKKGEYSKENMTSTVVENRNVIFSSIIYGMALGISKREDKDVIIAQGVHAGDHTIYPDCRPESIKMARELYKISNWGSERIQFDTPFVSLSKSEVLGKGIESMKSLGFKKSQIRKTIDTTISCYFPIDAKGTPCNECGTCIERKQAFVDNNI